MQRAHAGDFPGPEMMAAYEGNLRNGYAFVGLTSPSAEGPAWAVLRLDVSYLYYTYDGAPADVFVSSPGFGVGAGTRWRPPGLSLGAFLGYEVRRTWETPTVGVPSARLDHGPYVTADAYLQTRVRTALALAGYYGLAQDFHWARAGAVRQLLPARGTGILELGAGLDLTARGNADARALEAGALLQLGVPGQQATYTLRAALGREVQPGAAPTLVPALGTAVYASF